jgi:type IV conjugative transfer system protein TraL
MTMSTLTRHVILNYVDTPLKFLLWTKGEIGLFLFPAFAGLFFNQFILGLVVSFLNYRLFKIYQQKFGRDQFQAVCYWFLPHVPKKIPAFPPSYIREYIG